ncbi:replication factor A protein 3 [Microthyrium microscopicum]|uniref:Replication factor A protein 3 n=1 Tax=Microthyrium microscopicum TaxID=703497 RepID=A0A6A6UEL5_9PEZI|nr:replication factor A protein 3 [Microthyrium microscopicum]
MDSVPQTPRINARYLEAFKDHTVRVVGKVTDLRGNTATIEADGPIVVQLNRESHLQLNSAVEVVGKVNADLSIKIMLFTDFGKNFDYAAMDAVVDATHRYKEIFYSDT